jgi:predicted ATPase/DNA-binding winged helix-turn-helix (wHTH) protein
MAHYLGGREADVRLFPPFRFDVRDERLWKGIEELKVRRKPFAILKYLTANPRHLVTQEELIETVWGKVAMSESLLRTHVSELRRLLGEGVIETVAGRGYRFLLDVQDEKPVTSPSKPVETRAIAANLIGRGREMDALQQRFEAALNQKRQVIFITGDPGIGKTSLVDAFFAQIAVPNGALIASGTCVEQVGTGESYLPVLAALGALCRGPDGEAIVKVLSRHAPMWLTQMPGLLANEKLKDLRLRVHGATPARMVREIAEAFEVLAAERPVVLLLEDMQWSDRSTIDLVAMLGARRESARVLVIATSRSAELVKGADLAKVIAQLNARKQAITLQLEAWSASALGKYLTWRFADHRFPEALMSTVHAMTAGNPLFSIAVVDDLESRQMVRLVESRWELATSVAEVAKRRPDSIRQLIGIQIDRLKPPEQRVVEAASLVGLQFASGTVAHALELQSDEVDLVCDALAHERRFFQFVNSEAWSDGTTQSHHAFVHALYRDAALARIPSATKRIWDRRIAKHLEAAYAESSESVMS